MDLSQNADVYQQTYPQQSPILPHSQPQPQPLVHSPNFAPQDADVKHPYELISSPQLDPHIVYAAPSPTPSVASVYSHHSAHSVHSVHSVHSPHSQNRASPHFGPTYLDTNIPTFHGRQGSFAGFVGSAPLGSPLAPDQGLVALSPVSPYANGSFSAPFVPVHGPRRVSVSSVASSHPSMDWPEAHGTPEADMVLAHLSQENLMQQQDMINQMNQDQMYGQGLSKQESHDGGSPPAWAEMKTKAGKDRKRLPLACIACRRKKIRCSGQKPACKHCLRSRQPCVYKVNARKAAPRTDYMAMLDKRLKRMEDRVMKLVPKENEATNIPRAVVKPTNSHIKSTKKTKKRSAEEAFGSLDKMKPFSIDAKSKESEPKTPKSRDVEYELSMDGIDFLPPKEIQLHLAEIYFDWVYGQSYPLLHKSSFMRDLAAGKVPPVLILTICAISARFASHPQITSEPAYLRGEDWASRARTIALKHYDNPSTTIVIVYLLLSLYEFGTCQGGRSWMFGGMAQRMAFMMQLHKDQDTHREGAKLPFVERETRRRILWSCYMMDKFISSGSDRPMCFTEECITATLPVQETLYNMEIESQSVPLVGKKVTSSDGEDDISQNIKNLGVSAYVVRLVAIWGRLIKYLNLGGRLLETVPMWKNTSQFCQLGEIIKNFEFPEELKWTIDNLEIHKATQQDSGFIYMHLIYQHLRTFLHRFAIPGYGLTLPKDIPQSFVAESQKTALDAASKVSQLIEHALNSTVTSPFSGYIAFYSSTVHVQGAFAKNTELSERSKRHLNINIKYLQRMSHWWGMFHHVREDLADLYRKAEETSQGVNRSEESTDRSSIFQFGDWFDVYPNGVEDARSGEDGVAVSEFYDGTLSRTGTTTTANTATPPSVNTPPSIGHSHSIRHNFAFTATNMNIPIDSFVGATPYVASTSRNQTSSPSNWFQFQPESRGDLNGDFQYTLPGGSASGQSVQWYLPWSLQPPTNLGMEEVGEGWRQYM